jgi:hypothetical protein
LVLFPRYTALYGALPFYSAPVNVKGFARALISAWRGTGLGGTPATVAFELQQSADLGLWHAIGSTFTPTNPGEDVAVAKDLLFEWVRLKATVSGTAPYEGATVWAVGAFVPREPADG